MFRKDKSCYLLFCMLFVCLIFDFNKLTLLKSKILTSIGYQTKDTGFEGKTEACEAFSIPSFRLKKDQEDKVHKKHRRKDTSCYLLFCIRSLYSVLCF